MYKILIVEDDYFIGDIYNRCFKEAGYEVGLAVTGLQAKEFLKAETYDIILLDIMLPEQNGLEVLKWIRSPGTRCEHTPVFLITNLGQENIIDEAFNVGADGYILKAKVMPEELVSQITKFLSNPPQKPPAVTDHPGNTSINN